MNKNIDSPVNPDKQSVLLKRINLKSLIKKYHKMYGINVEYLFKDIKELGVYQCLETSYKFYYPFEVAGDSKFYEHFQQFDWYYMDWKWEHEITTKYLKNEFKVLEVGCAHGAFLEKISDLYDLKECIGLELNESAIIENKKWKILNESIFDYKEKSSNKFDVVCSFQVLEHIAEVHSFIQAKIDCLKQGGKLIISVPNNDSFIKKLSSILNMPPHHMGLWDKESLSALQKIFPLKLIDIHYEELQDYHIDNYLIAEYYSPYSNVLKKIIRKVDDFTGKYNRLKKEIISKKENLIGQTILVVFEKN